jgi:hypothetical protein
MVAGELKRPELKRVESLAMDSSYEFTSLDDLKSQVGYNSLWDELIDIVEIIENTDYKKAGAYINIFCEEEKKEIIELFKKEFHSIPNTDRLKFETLNLLGRLGITIDEQ